MPKGILGVPRPFVRTEQIVEVVPTGVFPEDVKTEDKQQKIEDAILSKYDSDSITVKVSPGQQEVVEGTGFKSIVVRVGRGPLTKIDIENIDKALDAAIPSTGVDNMIIRQE